MNHLPTLSSIFEGAGLHKVPATGATILLVFAFLLFWHRDGRAFGTRSRPDLSTVPGTSLLPSLASLNPAEPNHIPTGRHPAPRQLCPHLFQQPPSHGDVLRVEKEQSGPVQANFRHRSDAAVDRHHATRGAARVAGVHKAETDQRRVCSGSSTCKRQISQTTRKDQGFGRLCTTFLATVRHARVRTRMESEDLNETFFQEYS